MHAEGMISLVNAREVISTSGKEIILLVTSRKQLVSGKERRSKTNWKRIYSGSYPNAELLRRETIQNRESRRFLGELIPIRKQSEAELNHHGDVHTSHIIKQSNSKYFEA